MNSPALSVRDLAVRYGPNQVVSGVNLDLWPGTITGLVGESGCGKSTAALASLGYVPPGGTVDAGSALLGDEDLLSLPATRLRRVWGSKVAFLAQSAGTALNPSLTISRQLEDPLRQHTSATRSQRSMRKVELLESVGLPNPEMALLRYPHQFSGGQQQRIALAIALACRPQILVLDEPTTGLDVTTQMMVSKLLTRLVAELGIAALYVSHDIALLNSLAHRLIVMYAGEVVEAGGMGEVTENPRHPYTRALMAAIPNVDDRLSILGIPGEPPTSVVTGACSFAPRCLHVTDECSVASPPMAEVGTEHLARCLHVERLGEWIRVPVAAAAQTRDRSEPLLVAADVVCAYRHKGLRQVVVDRVSCELDLGETLGIVGESGSGKSTFLRALAGLHPAHSGRLELAGKRLETDVRKRPRDVRRRIQLVFQDPASSLNPRETVYRAILRPIRYQEGEKNLQAERTRVEALMADVRLSRALLDRYPWELSGGQQQRVAIARALASNPSLLLCDEVTSALDVSVQASIIELLLEITSGHDIGVIFVSHDLAVVRSLADRVLVMRQGAVCESGDVEAVFRSPQHPYTVDLVGSIPRIGQPK